MNNSSRQNEVSMASLYYRCEKYSEIIKIAKKLIQDNPVLSESEMAVFIEGYKYKLNELRKSLVKLLDLEQKEIKRGSSHAHLIRELIDPKISELSNLCDDFNAQIDILITKAKNFDSMANLSRLKLDFLRYKCQFIEKGEEWQKTYDEFFGTINKIETIGKEFLGKNNINSLYIQLCKCVFYYEVLNKPKEAVEMGKTLLKNVLCPPEKQPPPLVAKIEKVEEKKEEEIKPSVIDDEKKNEKKDDKKKTSAKKRNNNKSKDEKNDKDKGKDKESKNTESKEETFPAEKTLSDKKTENNFSSKEETRDFNITFEKAILTPELKQFIYILRTDIILWSGKNESDVKL
jgi:hypothetical protein